MHSDKLCILILLTSKVLSDAVKFPSANFVLSVCCTVCFSLLPFLVLVEHFYDSILFIFLTHKLYLFHFFMVVLSLQYIFQTNLSESSNNSVSLNVQCISTLILHASTINSFLIPLMTCHTFPLSLYQILQKYFLDKLIIRKNRLFILPLFIYSMLLYLYVCLNACPPSFSFSLKNSSSYLAGQMCW